MDDSRIVTSAGSVFAISDSHGDIHHRVKEGFYAYDTRFLSLFRLTIQGRSLDLLASGLLDHSLSSFYCTNLGTRGLPAGSISVVRDRYLEGGLHEDIQVINDSRRTRRFHLQVVFDSDFADIFQVRLGHVHKAVTPTLERREGQDLALTYRRDPFRRETWISFSTAPAIEGKVASFDLVLAPRDTWRTCITVLPVADGPPSDMKCREDILGPPFGAYVRTERPATEPSGSGQERLPLEMVPALETDCPALRLVYKQAVTDLQTLRIKHQSGYHLLAAGLPWFMAVFGRDSMISAIQTKLLDASLMVGTLRILASLQAREVDRFREAQPGKILHEVRVGELSVMEEVPHSCYYGTVDATPLFLRLLWEAFSWTGDLELLYEMLPAAEAALRWIADYGDLDGDGFIEYRSSTPHGLKNQGWKDSGDSISFADGKLARGPIALVEAQAYVYDAKRCMAEIYRLLGNFTSADRLDKEAEDLRRQFEEAFWMPEQDYYALALDGQKRHVNSISSNPGHCLWTGIVEPRRAAKVVQRLMAPDMFSGWGIRTLSSEMSRYRPLSYHNGSVWPHDNSLIAAGMARYGFSGEARKVALAMVDAGMGFSRQRLPELFAGYPRRECAFPVPYPTANAPQAWSAGAVIYLLETLLGVWPAGERLLHEAPSGGLAISLAGVRYRGSQRVL